MLRVVLVDDEEPARRGLRRMLGVHERVEILGEADHVASAVKLISDARPDAIFLDIGMPEQPGFEILGRLPYLPAIVVVTAHANHAVRAFNVNAVDYLLKPIFPTRLAESVLRLERAVARSGHLEPMSDRVLRLRAANRVVQVASGRVVAVHAEGDFARILIEQQAPLLVLQPLKQLELDLPLPPFLRASAARSSSTAGGSGKYATWWAAGGRWRWKACTSPCRSGGPPRHACGHG